jgi:hypothetical protein
VAIARLRVEGERAIVMMAAGEGKRRDRTSAPPLGGAEA